MIDYCPEIDQLVAAGQKPVGWQFNQRRLMIAPHENYHQPDLAVNYQLYSQKLGADLGPVPTIGPQIDLETRCRYYDNYGLTPFESLKKYDL